MGKIRVLIYNILISGLVIAVSALVLELDERWLHPLPDELTILAWPLFFLGSILILLAVFILLKFSGSTGAPADPTQELVTSGLYRWLRNPIYLGDILLLFGVAFFTQSLAFLLLAILSIPCADLFVRLYEEPKTERRFGEGYREYKRFVPRWIPKIPRRCDDDTE
jgi:protein-S-isoprenylcysteine O-methyltransferase Ste14